MEAKKISLGLMSTLIVFGISTVDNLEVTLTTNNTTTNTTGLQAMGYNFEPIDFSKIEDEQFTQRLKDLNSKIPLEFNQLVKRSLSSYLNNQELTAKLIGKAKIYQPMIRSMIDSEGVPYELMNLPIIESAMEPHAISSAGAVGLWQFMKPTGELFDLKVNDNIDERRDPEKSTQAAIQYLKQLHDRYDDWLLALAAYNCGPGNVNKAMKRAGGKKSYWELRSFLPRETRYYVPRFIAVNYLMNYYDLHGIYPQDPAFDFKFDYKLLIERNISLDELSSELKVSKDLLQRLNPAISGEVVYGAEYPVNLRIPFKMYQADDDLIVVNDDLPTNEERMDIFDKLPPIVPSSVDMPAEQAMLYFHSL